MTDASTTLNDVCEFIVDCLHATAPIQEEGYPLIRTPNIGKGRLKLDGVYRVSEDTYETWTRRAAPETDDLILAREAPAGNVAIVKNGQQVCLGQRTVHLRLDKSQVDPDFLCYYLLAPPQQGALLAGETGATAKHVNMKDIRRLPLKGLPHFNGQRKIGQILSAYDDMIENNRRRIQLLEQAARLLYKEWFVHLRFPGHEHVKIKDGVPEGWEKRTIADVCTAFEDGDWIESKDQSGEDFRLLQISNIGDNEFVETGNFRYITSETYRNLRCNEVLPGDILISRMPKPIGRAWYVYPQPWRMVTAVDVTIARPNPELVDPFYYLYHLNSPAHIGRCELRATGATRPRVSRKNMGDLPILTPPMLIQSNFGEVASAVNAQRYALTSQNDRLAKARDLLLPRLMNGEVII
jgi:type I restriction enzyme, S subunit